MPVEAASRCGKTALHVACTWGQEAVVEARCRPVNFRLEHVRSREDSSNVSVAFASFLQ